MRVLVTGATGFVGEALLERLVQRGYSVTALVRETADVSRLMSFDIEVVGGDIRDLDAVRTSARGCDHVYHLAAATSWRKPPAREYRMVNVEGTANVARASLEAGVERLIYASTVGVYGPCRGRVDESTITHPDSAYRETKLCGEKVALSWHGKGLPVVIARLSTIYGPGSLRWLGFASALSAGRARLIGSGENHVHDVYISDAVDGLQRCAEAERVAGRCYILAGSAPIALDRLVEVFARELKVDPPTDRFPAAPFFALRRLSSAAYRVFGLDSPLSRKFDLFLDDRVFSISRARGELGYAPRTSMEDGVRETIEWYREEGYL